MRAIFPDYESIILPGTFGDKEVRLCRCAPERLIGIDVILLHGVHSSANMSPSNKFRYLAQLLTAKGCTAWLTETSRKTRCRNEFESAADWAAEAFGGKTFAQEQEDVLRAIKEVLKRTGMKAAWLWGFSLGGIIAASLTGQIAPLTDGGPAIDRLIFSGTGLKPYPEVGKGMYKTPILSTLRETLSADTLSRVRANRVISFRGEFDEVFSMKSCLEFIDGIGLPADKKTFRTIRGADHSLRHRNCKADPGIMEEMVDYLL